MCVQPLGRAPCHAHETALGMRQTGTLARGQIHTTRFPQRQPRQRAIHELGNHIHRGRQKGKRAAFLQCGRTKRLIGEYREHACVGQGTTIAPPLPDIAHPCRRSGRLYPQSEIILRGQHSLSCKCLRKARHEQHRRAAILYATPKCPKHTRIYQALVTRAHQAKSHSTSSSLP